MAFVEILNYGCLPGNPAAEPVILGRSPGIQQAVADEIVGLCQGWGKPMVGKDFHPAVISIPLKAKSAAKSAFAVVKVQHNEALFFQVAVISQSDFASFRYNPFALLAAGAFPDREAGAVLGRLKLESESDHMSFSPPPSSEDVGMVDEALHQLLASHKLYLPIEQSTAMSDRCLALLIEVMPVALKQQLRFTSFAPSPANRYHLAATDTQGCEFSGWKRLMMSQVGGTLLENQTQYVKTVRDCLAFGDLAVIGEQSKLLSLNRQNAETKKRPAPRVQKPAAAPVAATLLRPNTIQKPRFAAIQPSARSRGSQPHLGQMRGNRRQLPGAVVGLLVLAMSLGAGWTYLEFIQGGGIQWDELLSWPGQGGEQQQSRVASLLEVPNVGAVYNRQLKKIHRAGMIPGLNQETDQRRGLVNLKTEAAIPLLEQVDLFLELSEAGIRQGSRPDREVERLKALANQGHVLKVEMSRLELAWHSLSSGVNWKDLNHLSDAMVQGRRDSLARVAPSVIKAAATDMKFASRLKKLGFGTAQVSGMSQLLFLFQESEYSKKWCNDLYRAAELVSPSASTMTRAYRNSAFTLVRLKNAEHQDLFLAGAFADDLKQGVWPDEKVEDILPGLRREVGKFNNNETPPLLAGTLQLYQILGNPMPVVDELVAGTMTMEKLEKNSAVKFDPEVYVNYLQRIRYQAGLRNPDLYSAKQQPKLLEFEAVRTGVGSENQWQDQVAQQDLPFLKLWAQGKQSEYQQQVLAGLSGFDETLAEIQGQWAKLRPRVENGSDWTAVWVDLNNLVDRGLEESATLVHQGPELVSKYHQLTLMKEQMVQPQSLELRMITVRLDQEQIVEPEAVVFEFQVIPHGEIYQSEPFTIGPAAPAGSGWVGTTALATTVQLSPEQPFRGMIKSVAEGRIMLTVEYPSLSDRVGPGALARPRTGDEGSLLIKTTDSWWRDLPLPAKDAPNLNS